MPNTPKQPGNAKASKPIDKQLDELLSQIETVEPGTVDPSALPESFLATHATPEADTDAPTEAEIQALLNAPPPDTAAPEPAAEPAKEVADPEQADMLAALNSALQGLSSDAPADEPAEPAAEAATEAPAPAEEMSMEDKLQQEIASLMDGGPQAEAAAPATTVATEAEPTATAQVSADDLDDLDALEGSFESPENSAVASQASGTSTEDQIAMEIEGLLNTSQADSAVATEARPEAAIDELDNMLAQEIDEDDELLGDFHSVEDLTAGIKIENSPHATEDEHAATAREVAAELDSQPEDLPAPPAMAAAAASAEDPFKLLSDIADTAEKNEAEHQRRIKMQAPDWQHWLKVGKEKLLNACFLINWPARKFLTTEWRANLGYIALLNLFFGVGFWIVMIVF